VGWGSNCRRHTAQQVKEQQQQQQQQQGDMVLIVGL
jgi:hypothetical protein